MALIGRFRGEKTRYQEKSADEAIQRKVTTFRDMSVWCLDVSYPRLHFTFNQSNTQLKYALRTDNSQGRRVARFVRRPNHA